MLLTLAAFVTAIGLLVAVHEWGHYRMARACGVKVLRFSIGFGPRIWGWTPRKGGTEFSIAAIPLGGYVKMLDQREAPVASEDLPYAFDTQPLRRRAAIVAAGPAANLILALLLYSVVNWVGVDEPAPILARPPAGSLLANVSMAGGERVERTSQDGLEWTAVASFEDLRWQMAQAALNREDLQLEFVRPGSAMPQVVELALSSVDVRQADAALFAAMGLLAPYSAAVIGDLNPDGAARAAGLQPGDRVLAVGGVAVADSGFLRDLIRASGRSTRPAAQDWLVERAGQQMHVVVTPQQDVDAGQPIGRVGAVIGARPEMVLVRSGAVEGITKAAGKTWEVSSLTLRIMGRILTGEASPKNISGPITIADYAGRSASLGFTQFLTFLALISVSLGVLNLLPLPVLDGGHLLYYLWEAVTGRSPSEAWLAALQKFGVGVLLLMMSVAIFNDVSRLLG